MTDLDAHAIVSHMGITEREALVRLAGKQKTKRRRISTEMEATLTARDLIKRDEYDSLTTTTLGSAALKHIQKGI